MATPQQAPTQTPTRTEPQVDPDTTYFPERLCSCAARRRREVVTTVRWAASIAGSVVLAVSANLTRSGPRRGILTGNAQYAVEQKERCVMRQAVKVPQTVVDEHAMVAQTYAGFLVGHPVRAARYTTPLPGSVDIDRTRPWVEPNPVQDDCIFCVRLTDEDAERRVFGFQAAIDKEVLARKWSYLSAWVSFVPEDEVPHLFMKPEPISIEQPDGSVKEVFQRDVSAMSSDFANRRRFIEIHQYEPRQTKGGSPRPDGWKTKAASIVSLPLRLKRKMCIDWNHVYTRWMATEGCQYDFDSREFYKDINDLEEWNDFIGT